MSVLTDLKGIGKKLHLGAVQHDPARDWLLLLALALAFLIASMLWNGFFLISVFKEEATVSAPVAATSTPDAFQATWNTYQLRDAEEGKYRAEYRFNDPSK